MLISAEIITEKGKQKLQNSQQTVRKQNARKQKNKTLTPENRKNTSFIFEKSQLSNFKEKMLLKLF